MASRKPSQKPLRPASKKSPRLEVPAAETAAPATGGAWSTDLFDSNIALNRDVMRNIPGVRRSQDLFDDLSDDPADRAIAIAAEGAQRIPTTSAVITRPLDYGTAITYSFDTAHWQASRFSDATRYGVWYGSLELETTVYETAWHWSRFVQDAFPAEDREIRTERRVFDVHCDAILIDLRGKARRHPELVSRTTYAFCQEVGRYVHDQGLNGLLTRSARCDGTNAALFRPERLSNVRDKLFLTYRYNPGTDRFDAERTPGKPWLRFRAGDLG
jgi:hypothetical protein